MRNQWEKFKHRTLTKVFLGYAVVAWIIIQIIEAVLPTFETPLWVAQTLTFLLILGFPIAILVGWASEKLPASATNSAQSTTPQLAHATPRRTLLWIGAASCIVVGLFGFYMMPFIFDESEFRAGSRVSNSNPAGVLNFRSFRSNIILGATGLRGLHNTRSDIAITRDGTKLAYTTFVDGAAHVYIRDLTQINEERYIGEMNPGGGSGLLFFSENDEWLHFLSGGSLARVRIEGGSFQSINSQATALRSGYLAFDDTVIYSDANDKKLYRVFVSDGDALILPSMSSTLAEGRAYTWPRLLPGNENLLVTSSDSENLVGLGNIEVHNIQTGEAVTIIRSASNATYVESGHLVFVRDADVWAVPFDLETLQIAGSQVPIIEGVETNSVYGHAGYAISDDGKFFYLPGSDRGTTANAGKVSWVSREGNVIETAADSDSYAHMSLSPSEEEMVFTRFDDTASSDIYVWNLERNTLGRRTFDGLGSRALWSPDGSQLIYSYGSEGLRSIAANGTEQPISIFESTEVARPNTISPQGHLVFDMGNPLKVFSLDLTQEEQGEMVAEELNLGQQIPPYHASRISGDGSWLAYVSNETGRDQVYVRPFPNIDSGKWQVSTEIGYDPIWSAETNELFYQNANQQYSVNYEEGPLDESGKPSFIEFGAPRNIFNMTTILSPQTLPVWDYSQERQNFIIIEPPTSPPSEIERVLSGQTTLVVVDNLFGELNSLVPRVLD